MLPGLGNGDFGGTIRGVHAVVVTAVHARRNRRLVLDVHLAPWLAQALVLDDVEDLRQPGILIAAQRGVHDMGGDDARLVGVHAGAAQRFFAEGLAFRCGQVDAIGG